MTAYAAPIYLTGQTNMDYDPVALLTCSEHSNWQIDVEGFSPESLTQAVSAHLRSAHGAAKSRHQMLARWALIPLGLAVVLTIAADVADSRWLAAAGHLLAVVGAFALGASWESHHRSAAPHA